MAKIENLLAECLADLERGVSVEECLAQHPEQRDELEPLLRAAQQVRSAPEVGPSPAFRRRARARMVRQIHERESVQERRTESKGPGPMLLERLWPDLRIPAVVARLAVPAVVAVIILGMMGVGAVYASSDSLPGDSLYPVKLAGERARLALSFSDRSEARLHVQFASERLEEADALVARHRTDDIEPLMATYAAELEAASSVLQRQRAGGRDVASLAFHLQVQLAKQQVILDRVQEEAPDEARWAVQEALAALREAEERLRERPETPQASPVVEETATPTATGTPEPTKTATPTDGAEPAERTEPTETPIPPGKTKTPEAPGQTRTPQPPGLTKTAQPPGRTITPGAPGRTRTPQPPGQTRTPEPPGMTRTPQPPGQTGTPEPAGRTRTPQPPGQTMTPEPPGLTHTPQPPGQTMTPQPPGQTRTAEPPGLTRTPGAP